MTTGHDIPSHGHPCLPVRCQVISRRGTRGQLVGALRVGGFAEFCRLVTSRHCAPHSSRAMHPDRTPGAGDVPETGGDHPQLLLLPTRECMRQPFGWCCGGSCRRSAKHLSSVTVTVSDPSAPRLGRVPGRRRDPTRRQGRATMPIASFKDGLSV